MIIYRLNRSRSPNDSLERFISNNQDQLNLIYDNSNPELIAGGDQYDTPAYGEREQNEAMQKMVDLYEENLRKQL